MEQAKPWLFGAKKEYVPSDVMLVKAVDKSFEHPYGVMEVDTVVPGKPAMVILGGDLTSLPRHANYYTKEIRSVLKAAQLDKIDVYALYYKFGSRNSYVERINMFERAGRKIRVLDVDDDIFFMRSDHMRKTEPCALYLDKLYDAIIRPIISKNPDEIRKNAQMLRFYTHSHGGFVVRELAMRMKRQLHKMKMDDDVIKDIQQQIIAIQHAPIAPLEEPDFTTLTFASASDTAMNMHNHFSNYIQDNACDIYPSYIKTGKTHLFIVGQTKECFHGEHDVRGLNVNDEDLLTPDGKILFHTERNAIVNAMRIALQKQNIPPVRDLVAGHGTDFDTMQENGKSLYKRMVRDIRIQMQQNPKHGYQK